MLLPLIIQTIKTYMKKNNESYLGHGLSLIIYTGSASKVAHQMPMPNTLDLSEKCLKKKTLPIKTVKW